MKLIIDIDEEDRADIANIHFVREDLKFKIGKAIMSGTPLPKGHGRLIDADAFIAKLESVSKSRKYKELWIDDFLTVDDVFKAVIVSLQNKGLAEGDTPTIIEADKAEREGEE